MTPDEQLETWLAGNPQHNPPDDPTAGECCPDFSCCRPNLLAPLEQREAFCRASEEDREKMLMMFLGGGLSELAPDVDVHLAGDPANYTEPQ